MRKFLIIMFLVFMLFACERFVVDESKDIYLRTSILTKARYIPKEFMGTSSWQLHFKDGTIVMLFAEWEHTKLRNLTLVLGAEYKIYRTGIDGNYLVKEKDK